MRTIRMMAASLAAVALVATACGDGDDDGTVTGGGQSSDTTTGRPTFAAGTTMANLQSKGKIVVGVKFDQPGLGQKNPTTNKVEGFDIEIAKQIALGIFGGSPNDIESKIEFREATTPNREVFLENNTVDMVVATYTINDARKQRIDFAGPYYIAGQDIMVAKGNPEGIEGPEDLAGKTVCSVEGSTPAQRIRDEYPEAQLTTFDVYSKCADALANGQVQAVTTDNVILTGLVAGSNGAFELVDNPFTEEPYGIGLAKGDDEFRNFINDVLEQSFEDGSWAEAWDRTAGAITGEEAPEPPQVDRY